jgi:predicted acetyltransferase
MTIKILAASEAKKSELREMLSAYLRELSQYGDVDLGYRFFDSYWTDDNRWPYLIVKDESPVGFALVNTWSPSGKGADFALAEFYVRPEFRGMGVGKRAFTSLLQKRFGIWKLSVMADNETGKAFWERALASTDVSDLEGIELGSEVVHRFTHRS